MRSKTKRPGLSKYVPKVLNVDALHTMMCDTVDNCTEILCNESERT